MRRVPSCLALAVSAPLLVLLAQCGDASSDGDTDGGTAARDGAVVRPSDGARTDALANGDSTRDTGITRSDATSDGARFDSGSSTDAMIDATGGDTLDAASARESGTDARTDANASANDASDANTTVDAAAETGADAALDASVATDASPPGCTDGDHDGYFAGAGCAMRDCDDTRDTVHPGATESCNGRDDDCNGRTDDGIAAQTCGTGACARSVAGCLAGVVPACTPGRARTETCNGMDDNCDGTTDEALTESCYTGPFGTSGRGQCHGGSLACTGGAFGGACAGQVTPVAELCNGLDDNCNGATDEGIAAIACYTGADGTSGVGACHAGTQSCTGGGIGRCTGQVVPTVETCNGIDDNCNGTTDEGLTAVACYTGTAATRGVGRCHDGSRACTNGVIPTTCPGQVLPAATESCNNVDDNCSGTTDEGVTQSCYTGATGTAGVGACHAGTQTCAAGAFGACAGEVVPTASETCDNNVDDNCNGRTDEGCVANDLCSGATAYTITSSVAGTTARATNDYGCSCITGATANCPGPDVTYAVTLDGSPATYTFTSAQTGFDGALTVHSAAACGLADEVACNDDNGGNNRSSRVQLVNPPAGTYYVVQDGFDVTSTGAFTLTSSRAAIDNDTCGAAATITANGTYTGTTTGQTDDYSAPTTCSSNTDEPDVVYRFVARTTGSITLSTAGSGFDTVLFVSRNCGAVSPTTVACSDDVGTSLQSSVTFTATAGLTYYVYIDGYSGTAYTGGTRLGAYTLTVSGY